MGKSTSKQPSAVGLPVSVDNDGDLILHVGGAGNSELSTKAVHFKVDSTTLRRASPVFKALLFGPWLESTVKAHASAAEPWTASLLDDEPNPFKILMGLAHTNYKVISRPWDLATVYELLVLVDKYDTMHLLSPFAASMKETISSYTIAAPDFGVLMVLHCSWALGDEKSFARALRSIVLNFKLDKDDPTQLVYGHAKFADRHHLGPVGRLDHIAEVRQSILTEIAD